jgi:GNAT superfamily N-acetyltransferase
MRGHAWFSCPVAKASEEPIVPASSITRLQAYLCHSAQQRCQSVPVPPFTIFLHPGGEASEEDHAVPDGPIGDHLREPLARLREAFEMRARRTRIRFLAEFAPHLASALPALGMVEERSVELLARTPDSLVPPREVPGLRMLTLDEDSALDDVREGLDTNERGFDARTEPVTHAQAQAFRSGLVDSRAFIACIDEVPAGAGMFNPPYAGVTELLGIATVDALHRRGVASYLSAYAAHTAFERGVGLVYLGTDNPAARRVYERLGFRPFAVLVFYAEPPTNR